MQKKQIPIMPERGAKTLSIKLAATKFNVTYSYVYDIIRNPELFNSEKAVNIRAFVHLQYNRLVSNFLV